MTPRNNPKKFVQKWGNLWYLREFDYLPEHLAFYPHNLRKEQIEYGVKNWAFFNDYEKAVQASIEVRKVLGLKQHIKYPDKNDILNII